MEPDISIIYFPLLENITSHLFTNLENIQKKTLIRMQFSQRKVSSLTQKSTL